MTSLVAWFGSDQRGPASAYVSTDSRISWQPGGAWDCGKKVFACARFPEVFGYVGDVLFPFISINQLVATIDHGLLVRDDDTPDKKVTAIKGQLQSSFAQYPAGVRRSFQIAYFTRVGSGTGSEFHFFSIGCGPDGTFQSIHTPIPRDETSDTVAIWGSGEPRVKEWRGRWEKSSQGGTSRAVFSALCDSIAAGEDPLSGGPPQLAGLYRTGAARTFGIVTGSGSYFEGLPVQARTEAGKIEWRDRLFQRCDWTGKLLHGAQRHGRPKEIPSNH